MYVSNATVERVVESFGLDRLKTHTVHLDASPVFRPNGGESKNTFSKCYTRGKPFYLFVGSAGSDKNFSILLHAFGQLRDKIDHWLVFAGYSLQYLDSNGFDVAIGARVVELNCRHVHPDDELLCGVVSRHSGSRC